MLKILHFSDAHIDMAGQGKRDPVSGLPVRVLDFLKALDTIVDTALAEKVDLVLFAGDAYKDRSPAPTFQREWGRRIMRLAQGGIPVLLLVGNHDLSPAIGRAHALQEYDTLQVPRVRVADKPCFLGPIDLWNLPLQVIAIPWITRSSIMATLDLSGADPDEISKKIEERLVELCDIWFKDADPSLPLILTAHGSIQGAQYSSEIQFKLGGDFNIPGHIVYNPGLDYVAMGHIHKFQDLGNEENHPVVYSGSIERVDWGEAGEENNKCFVIAHIEKGQKTQVEKRLLKGRTFIDRFVKIKSPDNILDEVKKKLPAPVRMTDAMVRITVQMPREWDVLLDEQALRKYTEPALEFHFIRHLTEETRFRLSRDRPVSTYTPRELLNLYLKSVKTRYEDDEIQNLEKLADEIISGGE